MLNYKKLLATTFAGSSILLSALTPAFAADSIEISGNGADSDNEVVVFDNNSTVVSQSNNADIHNDIKVEANTGDNEAEDNNGGDVSIDTGNATNEVDVTNTANLNIANVNDCNGCSRDLDVTIEDNGADSDNTVKIFNDSFNGHSSPSSLVNNKSGTTVFQENDANIHNQISVEAKTGDNEAEENNGGDVSISTGSARNGVSVSNIANANYAQVGGNSDKDGKLTLSIEDNGADSDNSIWVKGSNSVVISQDNDADIHNFVKAEAETGDNEAEDNNGGDVDIDTGRAENDIDIDNMVNFNIAELDCCLNELTARIEDNGADSDNTIGAFLGNHLLVWQGGNENGGNEAKLHNKVDAESETGDNEAEENNGEDSEVSVSSGSVGSDVNVTNTANANVYGTDLDFDWSDLEDLLKDLDFGGLKFHFSLGALLSWFA